MKLKTLLLSLGLLASSCANAPYPFRIDAFFPLLPGCDISGSDGVFTSWGFLDVAAGSPQFFLGVVVTGAENITQSEIVVGSQVLERENRNRPVILQQAINYRLSKRVGATPREYLLNRTASFTEAGEVIMPVQLISPDLGAALVDGLQPSNAMDDFVDIEVDVEFRGEFSATRNKFSTGVLTYPIRAFRSAPTAVCTNGFVKFETDPATNAADFCTYVGARYGQTAVPPPPSACCAVAGPGGGAGC